MVNYFISYRVWGVFLCVVGEEVRLRMITCLLASFSEVIMKVDTPKTFKFYSVTSLSI